MGREAVISQEQVAAAAEGIKAAGGVPTLRAVRERLGGIGSMGTINRMLQQWKDSQARPTTPEIAIPPSVARALTDYLSTEIAQAKAPLTNELAEARQANTELAAENERLAREIEDRETEIARLASEKSAIEGRAEQLAAELAAAREESMRERRAAEEARVEVAKLTLRLEGVPRLEADLAKVREILDEERKARVLAEQQAAVAVARLEERGHRI